MSQRERKRDGGDELTAERLALEEKGGIVFGLKPEQGVAVIAAWKYECCGGVAELFVESASGP